MQVTSAYAFSKEFALKCVLSQLFDSYFPPDAHFRQHKMIETSLVKARVVCSSSHAVNFTV